MDDACPSCGAVGRTVSDLTLGAMLGPAQAAVLQGPVRRFCRTPDCDVAYYGEGGSAVGKARLPVRVGLKEREDPVPLCYCFGHTRASVRDELVATGRCAVADRIAADIRAGLCACEVKNPSGACCLGDVRKAVQEEQDQLERGPGWRSASTSR